MEEGPALRFVRFSDSDGGGDRSEFMGMWNLNAITPETEKTAHYFLARAYNFKLDQRWVSDALARQVHDIFLEDMADLSVRFTSSSSPRI